jgi:uncharacterized SAM-binding protein YcdF (DUF218 family)
MDVVLILGAQNDVDGNLSKMAIERATGGLREYQSRPGAKLMVTSTYGHFNRADMPHAHYMAEFLLARGVPDEDLLPFVESTNTVEEAVYSRRILDGMSVRSLCLVTSDFHVPRARLVFEHFFRPDMIEVVGVPNGVAEEELGRYQRHEEEAIQRIRNQGGVLFGGRRHTRRENKRTANPSMHRTPLARGL